MADLGGKGGLSLLTGSNCCDTCGFFLFRRAEDGSWMPRRALKIAYPDGKKPFRKVTFVSAADWDGDGVPDLLAVDADYRRIMVAPGPLGDATTVQFPHAVELPGNGDLVTGFAVADWDRDGKPGLLVEHLREDRSHGIYWYKNLGGPGLKRLAPRKLVLDIPRGKEIGGFCVADWNGDGWLDLITTPNEYTGKDAEGWRSSVVVHLRE